MSNIKIKKIGVTKLDVDAVVNAANEGLWEGGGVCGAIFKEAGSEKLTAACKKIGSCKTGKAVITPGFNLKAKYIIHAVGPVWRDGKHKEPQLLYGCYKESLKLAKENNCHSIGFPLISSGIFGYPVDKAWRKALQACNDFIEDNLDYDIDITFAVLDDKVLKVGEKESKKLEDEKEKDALKFVEEMKKSKNPMINGCQKLEKAIADYFKGNEKRADLLTETIISEIKDGVEVIVPIETPDKLLKYIDPDNVKAGDSFTSDEDIAIKFRNIVNDSGETVYPCFTNMAQVEKGNATSTMPIPLADFMRIAINENSAGISINPWDDPSLNISIEGIKRILNACNPMTQDMIDLEEGSKAYNSGDYKKAFELYKKAADAGNITAMSNLGFCYYYGRYVEVDKEKARTYWEKAAIFGDICATYKLGDMYRNGDLEEDLMFSRALYNRALSLTAEYGDDTNTPDAGLRILKYCPEDYDIEMLGKIAAMTVELFKKRMDDGDNLTKKLYEEAVELRDKYTIIDD